MSTLHALSAKLVQIETDIRSTKILVHQKGLENLNEILNDRSAELCKLLSNRDTFEACTTWTNLLDSVHESVVLQSYKCVDGLVGKALATAENRNPLHSSVLQKFLNLANETDLKISLDAILEKCFHCFGDRTMAKYFGVCYIKILTRNVLGSNTGNLGDIKISDWSRMVSYCFQLYEYERIQKLYILQALSLVIDCGCKYTQFAADLNQYIPKMKEIIADDHKFTSQKELIKLCHYYCRNLALDYRYEICQFLEQCLGTILKIYDTSLDEDTKDTLFKLCQLSLVVHSPDGHRNATMDVYYVADANLWHRHQRQMFHIVQKEIRHLDGQLIRAQSVPKLSHFLLELGSELCSFIFWHSDVWTSSDSDACDSKRQRRTDKLERLMELVQATFSWRWLSILSAIIIEQPEKLTVNDFQQLLQLVTDYQQKISVPVQITVLAAVCTILMDKYGEFRQCAIINEQFCTKNWQTMAETAFRTTNSALFTENIRFIQLFFCHQIALPKDLIATLLKTLLSNSVQKTDDSIELIGSIFANFNVNTLDNGRDIQANALRWLYPTLHRSGLKHLMSNDSDRDLATVANVTVLCIFSKINTMDNRLPSVPDDPVRATYRTTINRLKKNLLYKSCDRLLGSSSLPLEAKPVASLKLPNQNELKSVINEHMFEQLIHVLNERDANIDSDAESSINVFENVDRHSSAIALYANILDKLIAYESLDSDRFFKTILVKKIQLKIGQLDMMFGGLMSIFQDKECMIILMKLSKMCSRQFSSVLRAVICDHVLENTLDWLERQTKPSEEKHSSKIIALQTYDSLSFTDKVRYKAFMVLAYFCVGKNANQAFGIVMNYEFDFDCNDDISIVHQLIQEFTSQAPTQSKADWILKCLKIICQNYHRNQNISEMVVDLLPAVINYVKDYTNITDDIIRIVSSFLKQSKKKKYSPIIIEKLIRNIRHLARAYTLELQDEQFFAIFLYLDNFLASELIAIQYATIETLNFVFNSDWLSSNLVEMPSYKTFHSTLFAKIHELLATLTVDDVANKDSFYKLISTSFQSYSTILITNGILRKKCWFLVTELFFKHNLGQDIVSALVGKMCQQLNIDKGLAISENLCYILAKWLIKDYPMAKFPWYVTMSLTQSDFFYDHIQMLTLNILSNRPNILQQLVNLMPNETMISVVKPIVPQCLAYLLPMFSSCAKLPANCRAMYQILQENITDINDIITNETVEIVKHLLFNMWDEQLFRKFFNVEIDLETDDSLIDYDSFTKCLAYLQEKTKSSVNILIEFCLETPHNIHLLLLATKFNIQTARFDDQKLFHFFHFCVLLHNIANYLNKLDFTRKGAKQTANNVKDFFISDVINYMCNLLSNIDNYSPTFTVAVCNYLLKFCQSILPKYSENFELLLNYIVSILIPLAQQKSVAKLRASALKCMEFLIVTQKPALERPIANLDCFPTDGIFENFKKIHTEVKYKDRVFNLSDEIDYFLKVDERKLGGYVGLREHLSNQKKGLSDMYNNLLENPSDNSNLHRLVAKLLHTVQRSDVGKCFEAAKCLGELGPHDLSTITLKSESHISSYAFYGEFDDAVKHLCVVAAEKLEKLLLHPDARVLEAVCEAIAFLYKSKVGAEIMTNHPKLTIFQLDKNAQTRLYRLPTANLKLINIFMEEERSAHAIWIKRITSELFQFFGDVHLDKVAALQIMFADAMLPIQIQIILSLKSVNYNRTLKEVVSAFFQRHFDIIKEKTMPQNMENTIYLNKATIKVMLNVAECIRMYNLNNIGIEIELEWNHIAKAAQYCEAYFTSVLYAELWCLQQQHKLIEQHQSSNQNLIDDPSLQEIMRKAYTSIGNLESIAIYVDPIKNRLDYLKLNNSWDRLYFEMDAQTLSSSAESSFNKVLLSSGLYSLANRSMALTQDSTNQYECAWRLGDWNVLNDNIGSTTTEPLVEFRKHHYLALKSLASRDEMGVNNAIQSARESIISFLKHAVLECSNNIYEHLTSLTLLQQIEDFCEVQFKNTEHSQDIFEKWHHLDNIAYSDFRYKEPILAQRITIINTSGIRAKRNLEKFYNTSDVKQSTILHLATLSRKEGLHNFAVRHLASLYAMELSYEMRSKILLEDARLTWKLGDQTLAKRMLSNCVAICNTEAVNSRCTAIRKTGKYLADSYTENVKDVINNYFQKSLELSEIIQSNREQYLPKTKMTAIEYDNCAVTNKMKSYKAIARYADREYNQLSNYMRSEAFAKKKTNIERNQLNEKMNVGQITSKDEQIANAIMVKHMNMDKTEIKNTETECEEFLKIALKNYMETCALQTNTYGSMIFRIISLWFSNKLNVSVNALVKDSIHNIESYKFLLALPQISARLCSSNDDFSSIVGQIIERCAVEHPHHTISQILALANAYADSSNQAVACTDGRSIAARFLVAKLIKINKTTLITLQMDNMSKALIEMANKRLDQNVPNFKLSSNDLLSKLKNLSSVQCPTVNLPISLNQNYDNIISVHKWDETVRFVGGVNAPKKVSCLCSDGKFYPQLVKGRDDMRQDAVMQQIFTIMNNMLKNNKTTVKEKLKVKTYKVVPLSQRSGVLEWCANTMPLADYLAGPPAIKSHGGAHRRYRPNDLLASKCREKMMSIQRETNSVKLKTFKQICDRFHPVFQYFFMENFHNAGMWFEKRLAYTNSVATTSMIGYIMGIGDRHVSNILIDKSTAELVHIDFGIAFEQGKCLPTPEQVPFRLTRDIVAPFGVSGVDGVFRKTCEKTMKVLRQNKTMIITTLEVLLHDPLYTWALSNKEAVRRQGVGTQSEDEQDGEKMNTMAERALMRLDAKLSGTDDGTIGGSSTVEAHVALLIRTAMNPINLCRLFPGWQSHL